SLEKKRCVVSSWVSRTMEEKCSFLARSAMSSALAGALNRQPASKAAQRHKNAAKDRPNRIKCRSLGQRKRCPAKCPRDCNPKTVRWHCRESRLKRCDQPTPPETVSGRSVDADLMSSALFSAMTSRLICFGQAASHSPTLEQLAKPSRCMC